MTPPHLIALNEILISVAKGDLDRIILTFPPRHGKSETASKLFPAWFLGMNPWKRVMLVSYAAEFAATWGRKVRDILEEWGPSFFNVKVRPDVRAQDAWELMTRTPYGWTLAGGGGMVTAGIGGPLTGRGGDLIIVDDPVKNQEEAFSQTMRDKTWDWFNSTLLSRAEPGAKVIVIQTRWHEDDLAGRLIERREDESGKYWHLINFPALATENDALGREPGEALWPERYSAERLEEMKKEFGSYWFSALYQQSPIPAGDALFKPTNLLRYTEEGGVYVLHHKDGRESRIGKRDGTIFSTVDLAASVKTSADFTVISTFLETRYGDQLLLDVVRMRMEGPDHVPAMQRVWREWQPSVFFVEQVGFQLTTLQSALRAGLPVRPLTPDTDKVSRALAPAAKMEGGKIFFPNGKVWSNDVESELWRFPAGAHDDFVDTLSMAALASLGVGYAGNLG